MSAMSEELRNDPAMVAAREAVSLSRVPTLTDEAAAKALGLPLELVKQERWVMGVKAKHRGLPVIDIMPPGEKG